MIRHTQPRDNVKSSHPIRVGGAFSTLPCFAALFLSGCTTLSFSPQASHTNISETECRLIVDDERQNPAVIRARRPNGYYSANLSIPLAQSLRFNVCNSLNPEQRHVVARFSITDFECRSVGLLDTTTSALLTGNLSIGEAPSLQVQGQAADKEHPLLWSTACENATKNLFDGLGVQIGKALESSSK